MGSLQRDISVHSSLNRKDSSPRNVEPFSNGYHSKNGSLHTKQHTHHDHSEVWLLCFNLTNLPRRLQLIILACGVFVFHVAYGYLQELLFRLPGFKPFGFYLTWFHFGLYVVFAWIERKVTNEGPRKIPLKTYYQLAFYTVATMALSTGSLAYLNYPTQVIFKCCKLIPVLIGGIIIQGKKFGLIDFLAAICMSVGLTLFTLADSQVSPNFELKGIVMISLALVADAVIGNVQEKHMKGSNASNAEVIFYSYGIGFFYLLIIITVSGEIFVAMPFFYAHPIETYGYATIYGIVGYLGIIIVLTLVRTFGAFIAVTVTTLRKAVTIVLSFLIFTKPFTFQYVWSGMIVLAGIFLSDFAKFGLQNFFDKIQEQCSKFFVVISRSFRGRQMVGSSPHRRPLFADEEV